MIHTILATLGGMVVALVGIAGLSVVFVGIPCCVGRVAMGVDRPEAWWPVGFLLCVVIGFLMRAGHYVAGEMGWLP